MSQVFPLVDWFIEGFETTPYSQPVNDDRWFELPGVAPLRKTDHTTCITTASEPWGPLINGGFLSHRGTPSHPNGQLKVPLNFHHPFSHGGMGYISMTSWKLSSEAGIFLRLSRVKKNHHRKPLGWISLGRHDGHDRIGLRKRPTERPQIDHKNYMISGQIRDSFSTIPRYFSLCWANVRHFFGCLRLTNSTTPPIAGKINGKTTSITHKSMKWIQGISVENYRTFETSMMEVPLKKMGGTSNHPSH